jgi:hypothetical protein
MKSMPRKRYCGFWIEWGWGRSQETGHWQSWKETSRRRTIGFICRLRPEYVGVFFFSFVDFFCLNYGGHDIGIGLITGGVSFVIYFLHGGHGVRRGCHH